MRLFTFIVLLLFFAVVFPPEKVTAQADFTVTQSTSNEEVKAWVDSIFLSGVNSQAKKNITFHGDFRSVGRFTGGFFLGFSKPEGIIMTTGFAKSADKSNECGSNANASNQNDGVDGDPDLKSINNVSSHDACIIEFDFRPTVDTVRFSFVFASEEYHDFVLHGANDVFGFFLSGPDISGPFENNAKNIALIPNTDIPVAIDNINYGPGGGIGLKVCMGHPSLCNYCDYLVDNSEEDTDPNSTFQQFVYDAFTTALVAKNVVHPCKWHHIKLAVGDAKDFRFDTGVLLEKGSFNPGNIKEETNPDNASIYESCRNNIAVLHFRIDKHIGIPYMFSFRVAGSATRDVDYAIHTTTGADSVYIPIGSVSDSIIITPFSDTKSEGTEDVKIIYNLEMCSSTNENDDTSTVFIKDNPPFNDTIKYYKTRCEDTLFLSLGNVLVGVPPYEYNWFQNNSTDSVLQYVISGTDSVMIPCLLYDSCGFQTYNEVYVVVPELNVSAGPDKDMCNNLSVTLEGSADKAQFIQWISNPADPSLTGQESIIQPSVSPAITTQYSLKAWDNCTHEGYDTVLVAMNEAVVNITSNHEVCLGDTVVIFCNNSATYQWTANPPDPTLPVNGQDTTKTIKVVPKKNTTYAVAIVNDCGFAASDSVFITVNPLPKAYAGADTSTCKGKPIRLEATGGVQYVWASLPNDTSLYTNGQDTLFNPEVLPNQALQYTYIVKVTDNHGCTASDSVDLVVKPTPPVEITVTKDTICSGETLTLNAIGNNLTPTWSADPNDPSLTGQEHELSISVMPEVSTTYTLSALAAGFECESILAKTIDVIKKPLVTFSIENDTICQNVPLEIVFTGNASPDAIYTWDFSDGQIVSGSEQDSLRVQWPVSGSKNIDLKIEEPGCFSSTEQIAVMVLPTPVVDFNAEPAEGCAPMEVVFSNTVLQAEGKISYHWQFDTIGSDTVPAPSVLFKEPGNYTVSLLINSDGRCSTTKEKTDFIKVDKLPEADFEVTPKEAELNNATFGFTNHSAGVGALNYWWDFDDGNSSTETNPAHTYSQTGTFRVLLMVNTEHECQDTTSFTIIVHPNLTIYVPNAFTPNGDGLNDTFKVKGIGINKYQLQIYSRWGKLIYESKNLEDEWNGVDVPSGVYSYIIHATTLLDQPIEKRGTVTVVK